MERFSKATSGQVFLHHLIFACFQCSMEVVGHPNVQTLPCYWQLISIVARWMLPIYLCVTRVLSGNLQGSKVCLSLVGVDSL